MKRTKGANVKDPIHQHLQEALPTGYIAAYRILGNADESQEACQEAAARAWAARERYDRSKPFYPWFYRILKNHCLDRLRHKKRTVLEATPEPTSAASEYLERPDSAESQLVAKEQSQAVTQAVAQLPDDLREIIELRHFQDLSYEEIGEILGCPLGTVMSRLYRARKALRRLLQESSTFSFTSSQGVKRT